MKRPVLLFSALALALGAQAQTYYGNGYTIVESGEVNDRLSGLDAMVFKTIDAYSVQEGLEQLLQGSGWALAGADNADPQIWRLYRQPWPDNKRSINPMPLARALSWVAGDGWSLVVDPVNRLVSFEVNVRYAERPAPVAATVANTPADNAPLTASGTTRVSPSPYDPYASSVSYADSPSFSASHSTAGYGGSFSDGSYVASPHAILLTPPAGDDYNDTLTAPPPRKSVREVTALRPATTRLSDLKTVSPGAGVEKSGKAATGKKMRKATTGDSPALLPVSTGEKTATRSKTVAPANASEHTAIPVSGKKIAATATGKKTTSTADAGRKTATTPATEKTATSATTTDQKATTTTPIGKTATTPAATASKAAAPAAATDTKAAAKPATEAKAATPDKQSPATQATTSATTPAPAPQPNATSGENHP